MDKLLGDLMKSVGLESGYETDQKTAEQMKADSYNSIEGHLNEDDGYNCDRCRNKGLFAHVVYSETYQAWENIMVPCRCRRVRAAIRRLYASGLKNAAKNCRFDNFEVKEPWQQTLKDKAERFCCDQTGSWFFIGGQSGAGKTHLCTAIAIKAIKAEKDVHYMLWRDEIARLKASVTDSDDYSAQMNLLKNCDVLYIDDLFKTGKN